MNAKASFELLKAHAVISRSWILFQLMKKGQPTQPAGKTGHEYLSEEGPVRIRWYDRADHQLFDVCADDHCQRYQGITRMNNSQAKEAVLQTRGQVLWAEEGICDARFSKCCGGMLETFEHCWEEEPKSYLVSKRDWLEHDLTPSFTPDLRKEEQAEVWITGQPKSFCHTTDSAILNQILNDYDQETPDFYRWKVTYTKSELSRLVEEKAGLGLGDIQALIPLERGYSGRIVRLKLVGSRRTAVIGKELEIRKTLSPTHLYSSAFVVRSSQNQYTLLGAGWGHGVGLCQIGAAVMASNGYPYDRILAHYYPGSRLRPLYP
jgi:SpoIID/LytB domain protein